MKFCFFVLLAAGILQVTSAAAQQKKEPPVPINYAKINQHQWAGYKPEKAEKGKDAPERTFFSRLFGGGKKGYAGKPGQRGPDLSVHISAVKSGDTALLYFVVNVPGNEQSTMHFYVNPRHGHIKIVSDGGDGGDGGAGKKGKSKGGFNKMCGGDGGDGSRGGDAGYITVFFDSSAVPYANSRCMTFSNYGGMGGKGGAGGKNGAPASYKKEEKPYDGEAGMDGTEGNSSNRVMMIGPDGSVLGWR